MSVVHRFTGTESNFLWENVKIQNYESGLEGVTKQVPIGPNEDSNNFYIRYFRLEPGKKSNKESHSHEHGVIIMHGHAKVQVNQDFFELHPKDAVFISSNDLHQFTALVKSRWAFYVLSSPTKLLN